jgi:hypothetical protein
VTRTDLEQTLRSGHAPSGWRPELAALFEQLVASSPPFSTRRSGVKLLKEKVGIELSHRTLEKWPLPVQIIKGEATFPTVAMLEHVFAELNAAPVIMGGRKSEERQVIGARNA